MSGFQRSVVSATVPDSTDQLTGHHPVDNEPVDNGPENDESADEDPADAQPTDTERWLIVNGRRWRRTDPSLPDDLATALRSRLGSARATIAAAASRRGDAAAVSAARRRVGLAKHGLGERGPKWWEEPVESRLQRARAALAELDGAEDG